MHLFMSIWRIYLLSYENLVSIVQCLCLCCVFLFHIGLILAHLSDSLTNYLQIQHSGVMIAHLSLGALQHYCNMALGFMMMMIHLAIQTENLINKLETFYGNQNIQNTPSLQSPKKFVLDIKYILTRKMRCSVLNAPTSPMSTQMIIAIQGRQLHH